MGVKPGYKQTDVGVIPEEWEAAPCSELCDRIMVGIVIRPAQYYVRDGVPAFRSANIREDGITDLDLVFISEKSNELLGKSKTRTGDVLTVRTGYPGTSAVVRAHHAGSNCIDILITRPSPAKLDSDYLAIWVNSPFGKEQVLRNQGGLAQKHFNVGDMRNLIVARPKLPEQRAIADVLRDLDALLGALNRLMAKKRDVKQAAMQQLLAGHTRLPGFTGEWKVRRLGSVAEVIKGSALSKSLVETSGTRPCILYGELFTIYGRVIRKILKRTNSHEGITSRSGDVLMPGSTTTSGIDLATASALLVDNVSIGGDVIIIRRKSEEYDPTFLAYYLTHARKREIAELTQGITIHHLYGRDLKALSIELPNTDEQEAIAAVLTEMDAELAVLATKLAKTRELKQGIIYELLTGRTRLVSPEMADA